MERLERLMSRPLAKPYRSSEIQDNGPPFLNRDGHLDFSPHDIENPKNWSRPRKWYISSVCFLAVINATFASSAPTGCLQSLSEGLHVSEEAGGLVVTLFLLGYVAGPLLWAPLSELYGRRWICYTTFICYFAFNFLCAFTPNFAGLLVGRFLTGTFVSAAISNSPGVLVDIWGPADLPDVITLYAVMNFVGPALGPVTGGFLQITENWRWAFYELIWLSFVTMLLLFTIPETLPSIVLLNKAKRLRRANSRGYEDMKAPVETTDRTVVGIFKVALIRPWIILFDPISLLCAIYVSIVYCLLYMLFAIYPYVFQRKRGWNAGTGELPLIGVVIGACLGGIFVVWATHNAQKKKSATVFQRRPEERLPIAMVGSILFPIAMFWFAWAGEYNSIHWIVCTIAGVFLSASIMLIFVGYLGYLSNTYLMYTASALAANTVARSAAAASAPLFTTYMLDAMGVGGAGSLIGGVACLLAPTPFIFYKYGQPIMERSRFAPTAPKSSQEPGKKDEEAGSHQDTGNDVEKSETESATDH
ncbi:hypothetical protein M409DRAFT_65148 [Zasmidium cellare ATCC 36951]|uniref:Cercosporin MFS transporter CTB4 n=1 Tax=Zasmidium cellare ATCC 36951 TaxID=1080233 RepID=A0A6A6CRC9_ZASCE|nr:uncharacterized protein M409DRAFT_65148 [Zasmidium cellare ATCC 36951]KAF2168728.1 hypothetical protein M409DRAFT_65148 [Zasmidium cellare ATCC 36951]